MSQHWDDYQINRSTRKPPIDDPRPHKHANEDQIQFIERLSKILQFSVPTRDTKIAGIIGRWEKDLWGLSRSEASQVIDKFKQWKEERK